MGIALGAMVGVNAGQDKLIDKDEMHDLIIDHIETQANAVNVDIKPETLNEIEDKMFDEAEYALDHEYDGLSELLVTALCMSGK